MKLSAMKTGQRAIITYVSGEGNVRKRLFDMGVLPGVEVMVKKFAPLGDPIEISLRGYTMMLRKNEASFVETK